MKPYTTGDPDSAGFPDTPVRLDAVALRGQVVPPHAVGGEDQVVALLALAARRRIARAAAGRV